MKLIHITLTRQRTIRIPIGIWILQELPTSDFCQGILCLEL